MSTTIRRYVITDGSDLHTDIQGHVINGIGSNGEEVELIFMSEDTAQEYMDKYALDGEIREVTLSLVQEK